MGSESPSEEKVVKRTRAKAAAATEAGDAALETAVTEVKPKRTRRTKA